MTAITFEYDEIAWENLQERLKGQFGSKPDMQSIIFLIGHRELGQLRTKFSKSAKEDLLHVGVCTLLSREGYYQFVAKDGDGWPHFELNLDKPGLTSKEQEQLLRKLILEYFNDL
jgi:hypothetical protein